MRGMATKVRAGRAAENDAETPAQVGFCWHGGGAFPTPLVGLRAMRGPASIGEDLGGRRCRMTYLRAIGRALALAAFAVFSWVDVLVELITFALLCGGLVFFFGPAVLWARGRSARMRVLAGRWCEVEVETPYRPEPPEPVRERDGWYRDGNQLYKRAFWISWQHRLTWAMEDPATNREFLWQLVNPLGTLLLPVAVLLGGPVVLRGYAAAGGCGGARAGGRGGGGGRVPPPSRRARTGCTGTSKRWVTSLGCSRFRWCNWSSRASSWSS